jgi:hypothetical protein
MNVFSCMRLVYCNFIAPLVSVVSEVSFSCVSSTDSILLACAETDFQLFRRFKFGYILVWQSLTPPSLAPRVSATAQSSSKCRFPLLQPRRPHCPARSFQPCGLSNCSAAAPVFIAKQVVPVPARTLHAAAPAKHSEPRGNCQAAAPGAAL